MFVVVKTLYCARGYDSIQSLVYLVKGSLFGIKDFMALFVYSVFIFAMFTQLTKIDKPGYDDIHDDDEFPDILFLRHILNSFSNSVGDLNYPGYETNWNTDDGYMSPAMIALIFIHYYMQIIFMVIVLLNLLISVVSENYDNITDKKDEIQLKEWAVMIVEATIHTAFWSEKELKSDFQMVSVLSQLLESEDSEVLGITKRIRQTLKKEIVSVKDEIKGAETRIEAKV